LEHIDTDARIMENGSWRNWFGSCGLDLSGSGGRPMAGPDKHGNEPLGSV